MAEKYTESQKKASIRYAKGKLKRVPLDLKKEDYERLSVAAKSSMDLLKKPYKKK